jgi:hypothetical protein
LNPTLILKKYMFLLLTLYECWERDLNPRLPVKFPLTLYFSLIFLCYGAGQKQFSDLPISPMRITKFMLICSIQSINAKVNKNNKNVQRIGNRQLTALSFSQSHFEFDNCVISRLSVASFSMTADISFCTS